MQHLQTFPAVAEATGLVIPILLPLIVAVAVAGLWIHWTAR